MITITKSVTVAISADRAWAILADYARDPAWRTGVVSMTPEPAGLVAVGTRTHEEMRFAGKSMRNDGVVTAVEPGRHFAWKTVSGADANGSRTVTPLSPESCRIDLVLNVVPHGSERFMAPLLVRMLRNNLRKDLARLSALLVSRETASAPIASPVSAT